MTIKIGKYSLTLKFSKEIKPVLSTYPTITEIMKAYNCGWDEARNRLTGYHLERIAQKKGL